MLISPTNTMSQTRKQVTLSLAMSREEAFQVHWQGGRGPNNDLYGPIGTLLETDRLNYRDLAWAVGNAYKPEVRTTAYTILATWLGTPETSEATHRFGPTVIGNSKYLEEKEWASGVNAIMYGLLGSLIPIGILVWWLSRLWELLPNNPSWPVTLSSALIALAVLALIFSPVAWWLRRQWNKGIADMKNYRAGREGEEWIADQVRACLDSRWTVFRTISLPKKRGDLDIILVGPPGIWVLEVKAYKSPIRLQNRQWSYLSGQKWKPCDSRPDAQASYNAVCLHEFLSEHGVSVYVNAVVALTQPQQPSNIDSPRKPVWHRFQVEGMLSSINVLPATLNDSQLGQIVTQLKGIPQPQS